MNNAEVRLFIDSYYILLTFFVLFFLFVYTAQKNKLTYGTPFVLLLLFVIFIALRPYSWQFTDMPGYKSLFNDFQMGIKSSINDELFGVYAKICSMVMSPAAWFFITGILYIGFTYNALKRIFAGESYFPFLAFTVSFFFFSYGTNTIRAGLAGSILLVAISFLYKNKWKCFFIGCLIAIGMHKSMCLPVIAILLARYYGKTKLYMAVWGGCFCLSLLVGPTVESFLSRWIMMDDRLHSYLLAEDKGIDIGGVFRWDFFIYGFLPIAWGYWLIYRKKYADRFFLLLFHAYLLTNGFWLLVIRAAFTDRFAYLSWIFLPLIFSYPLIYKGRIAIRKQFWFRVIVLSNLTLTLFLHFK